MKRLAIAGAVLTALAAIGCGSHTDDDASVKPGSGVALNPSGKPKNEQEAAYAGQMQKTGDAINAQRMKDAAAMAAAKERTGGK